MYIYMYMYMYIHKYMYIVRTCICTCTLYVHVYIHVHCTYIYTYMYIVRTCIHTCTCTYKCYVRKPFQKYPYTCRVSYRIFLLGGGEVIVKVVYTCSNMCKHTRTCINVLPRKILILRSS